MKAEHKVVCSYSALNTMRLMRVYDIMTYVVCIWAVIFSEIEQSLLPSWSGELHDSSMTSKSLDLGSTHLINLFISVCSTSLLKNEGKSRNRNHSGSLTVIDREEHKSKYNSEGRTMSAR